MVFEGPVRSIKLEVESEIDSWAGYRYEVWKDGKGHWSRRTKIFIAPEIEPEPGPVKPMGPEAFAEIWEKMVETSKDPDSVGVPRYVMREIMLMPLDPTMWSLWAKEDGEEVLFFTAAGGPRTPVQEELCDLIKNRSTSDEDASK